MSTFVSSWYATDYDANGMHDSAFRRLAGTSIDFEEPLAL